MPGEILTATLSPNGSQPDTLDHRTLTFVPTVREFIEIGRSSKREAKNLTPACDNAWFDSRVMSRHHARLWVSFENRALYICDGGSMHGTWVNDVKIMPDQDVELHNDDVLTFGNDVTRGAETFPPLKVTCQYGFHTSASTPDLMHSINTFIVPDDDENEIVQAVNSAPAMERDNMSEDSDMGHSTPITSPSNKEAPLSAESKGVKTLLEVIDNPDSSNGTSRSPILLDNEEPLATPRMTPPSVLNILGEPQGNTADGVQSEDNAQPSVADYMNDIEIEYSDDDNDDEDEMEDDDDQEIGDEDDSEAASADEVGSDDEKVEQQPLTRETHLSATTADEKKDQESCKPRILESIMPFSKPDGTTRLPSLLSLSSNGWSQQGLPESQYSDLPSTHGCAPSSENPWNQESQQPGHQELSNAPASADREHKTRVSIADILDTQAAAQGATPSKRKASEMMSEDQEIDSNGIYAFDANPTPLEVDTSKETYSQDAQPQPSLSQFNDSTQATNMSIIAETAPGSSGTKEERPSKRVKVDDAPQAGRGRGFVSHTATAIAGALVGSVGTVALLASLPPDFFA